MREIKLKLKYTDANMINISKVYFVTVHGSRDDGSFGRHINLHLTYSFQQQNPKSSPIFASAESSLDELSQESALHCMQGEV